MLVVVVNRHKVAANRKAGTNEPVLRVSRGRRGKPRYASSLEFSGTGRLIYDPAHPLPCGATVWLELEPDRLVGLADL